MAFTDLAVLVDFEQSFCADLIDTWRFENETGENIYIYIHHRFWEEGINLNIRFTWICLLKMVFFMLRTFVVYPDSIPWDG